MFLCWFQLAAALEPAVPLSVMAAHAERVAVVEVTSSEARWAAAEPGAARDGDIETVVWVHVDQALRGELPDTLEILVQGGQIGEYRTGVSGQPLLLEDHRYLLLLVTDFEGRTRVMGERAAIELRSELAPEAPEPRAVIAAMGPPRAD